MQETRINNKWSVKIAIFFVALAGLGLWGLYDALIKYPAMGEAAAEWAEREYLAAAQDSGELLVASVPDPDAAMRDLRTQKESLQLESSSAAAGGQARRAITRLKRLEWLESLTIIGQLSAEHTTFDDPQDRLETLRTEHENLNQPKPLAAYDIPMQWVFVVVGFGGASYLAYLMVNVSRRKYRYEEETHTLKLPTGESITPDHIAEVDKRKWDKFIVVLRLKDGSSHRLDLLRYTPLEEWILEMEKLTDGYEAPEEDESSDEDAPGDETAMREDQAAHPS